MARNSRELASGPRWTRTTSRRPSGAGTAASPAARSSLAWSAILILLIAFIFGPYQSHTQDSGWSASRCVHGVHDLAHGSSPAQRLAALSLRWRAPGRRSSWRSATARSGSATRTGSTSRPAGRPSSTWRSYYIAVGDGIVRALRDRPCMLHRFPTGVTGEKVHQKRLPRGAPDWVQTVRVHFPRWNRHADELCVQHPADVVWAVQMSTVEFHPWNSRAADTEQPDEWRIDIDPMPRGDLRRRAAGRARRARGARRAGRHRLAEDLGRQGHARLRADRAEHGLRRRAPGRARVRPRGRAALRPGRPDLVAQGPRPGVDLRRLQPEHPRPHHPQRLLGARRAGGAWCPPRSAGTRSTTPSPATSPSPPCRPGSPSSATCTPGIDDAVFLHRRAAGVGRPRRPRRRRGPADPIDL